MVDTKTRFAAGGRVDSDSGHRIRPPSHPAFPEVVSQLRAILGLPTDDEAIPLRASEAYLKAVERSLTEEDLSSLGAPRQRGGQRGEGSRPSGGGGGQLMSATAVQLGSLEVRNPILVAGVVTPGSHAVGRSVLDLRQNVSDWHFILAAVVRGDETEIGRGDTHIEAGDHVVVMVEATHVNDAIELFGIEVEPISRVVILGGTRIAEMTAELLLASGYEVLIIEEERERAATMARRCPAQILQADPTDPDFGDRINAVTTEDITEATADPASDAQPPKDQRSLF